MGLLDRFRPPPPQRHVALGVDPRAVPIGMYTGNPPLPQQPRLVLVDQLHDSLTGSPGIRQSLSTDRAHRYFGTDAVPGPRFPTGPPRGNRPEELEMAALKAEPRHGPGVTI